MIGIDTNVLVRFFVADDARQATLARQCLDARSAEDPAFVSLVVIVEFSWVLKRLYDISGSAICDAIRVMVDSPSMLVERRDLVVEALDNARGGNVELADFLIAAVARSAGATRLVTFDRRAARHVPGMELLK